MRALSTPVHAIIAPTSAAVEHAPLVTDTPTEGTADSSSMPPSQNAGGSAPIEAPVVTAPAVAEPEMIEVWRPGRPDGPRRKREDKKPEENKRPPRRRERSAQPRSRVASRTRSRFYGFASKAELSLSKRACTAEAPPRPRTDGERKESKGRPRPSPPGRDGRPERKERGHGEGAASVSAAGVSAAIAMTSIATPYLELHRCAPWQGARSELAVCQVAGAQGAA